MHGNQKVHHAPKRTLPWPFRHWGLGVHITTQLIIIAAVTGLWVVSNRSYGIAAVVETPTSPFEGGSSGVLLWTYSLLWTAVPAFLMARYTEIFATTLNSLKSVQVILELCSPSAREKVCVKCGGTHGWGWQSKPFAHWSKRKRRDKATPGETILLDYDSMGYSIPIWNSWKAYRNNHYLISISMLVKFLLTLTGALAAAILAVANVSSSPSVPLQRAPDFDGWALSLSSSSASVRPATDVVSATINNGAEAIPWTTATHAFRPFYYHQPAQSPASGNLTGHTTAYSATLDCVIFDPVQISSANGIQLKGEIGNNATLTIKLTDRGCSVSKYLNLLSDSSTTYFKSWAETDCGKSANYSRFGFFSGIASTTSPIGLDNITITSCIPAFWNSSSIVTVTSNDRIVDGNRVLSFTIQSSTPFDLPSRDSYLGDMPLYAVADPSEQLHMDTVSRLSYEHAMQVNPASPLNSDTVVSSFETIFSAVFSSMSSLVGFKGTGNTGDSDSQATTDSFFFGVLSIPQNRLFVVWQPAAAVIAIMVFALIVTVYIALVWVPRSKALLLQNPELVHSVVLGYAMIVNRSDELGEYIDTVKREALMVEMSHRGQGRGVDAAGTPVGWWGAGTRPSEAEEDVLQNIDLIEFARKKKSLNQDWECELDQGKIRLRRRQPSGYWGS
ncbi:hypothetical protein V8F06_013956 [Rhypophila decipiens]